MEIEQKNKALKEENQHLEKTNAKLERQFDEVMALAQKSKNQVESLLITTEKAVTYSENLKEKMKFYLESFESRPTYQVLEKKLEKIIQFCNEGREMSEIIKIAKE